MTGARGIRVQLRVGQVKGHEAGCVCTLTIVVKGNHVMEMVQTQKPATPISVQVMYMC